LSELHWDNSARDEQRNEFQLTLARTRHSANNVLMLCEPFASPRMSGETIHLLTFEFAELLADLRYRPSEAQPLAFDGINDAASRFPSEHIEVTVAFIGTKLGHWSSDQSVEANRTEFLSYLVFELIAPLPGYITNPGTHRR
jgi:hypothetical protein